MIASSALILSGVLCFITGLVHSIVGERRLIGPQLQTSVGVMQSALARSVTRFAWHWTTVLWMLIGGYLIGAGLGAPSNRILLWAIGLSHIAAGLLDAYFTRGKHIGWPFITLIGALIFFALISNQ